jgi:hypothetical protein
MMPNKFLILPNADCDGDGLPNTLTNAVIDADGSLTGLTNATGYRALVLQNPSPTFTPSASSSSTPTYQAAGAGSGDTTASPAWPTHAVDDIGILIVSRDAALTQPSTPSGWTKIGDYAPSASSGRPHLHVYYRVATSTSEANPTISNGAGATITQIFTVRGAATVAALGAGSTSDAFTTTASIVAGTPAGNNRLIMGILATRTGSTETDPVSTWTNADLTSVTDRGGGTRNHFGQIFWINVFTAEKATAAAVGNTTTTFNASLSATWAGVHLEFAA